MAAGAGAVVTDNERIRRVLDVSVAASFSDEILDKIFEDDALSEKKKLALIEIVTKLNTQSADNLTKTSFNKIIQCINLCQNQAMIDSDKDAIVNGITSGITSLAADTLFTTVLNRRRLNSAYSNTEDAFDTRGVLTSFVSHKVITQLKQIDETPALATKLKGSSWKKELLNLQDKQITIQFVSILEAIGLKNLDYLTIKYVFNHIKEIGPYTKEICDVFKALSHLSIAVEGLRAPIMKLALDSNKAEDSFKNLIAIINTVKNFDQLDKKVKQDIINDVSSWTGTDRDNSAKHLKQCIEAMRQGNVRLSAWHDRNKVRKLMLMNPKALEAMAGALQGISSHPEFSKHGNDIFNAIYDKRESKNWTKPLRGNFPRMRSHPLINLLYSL